MRNKKTIMSLVALVIVVSICVFAFAGCDNNNNAGLTELLAHFAEETPEVSVHNVDITTIMDGYSIFSVSNDMVIARKFVQPETVGESSYYVYRLINAAEKKVVVETNDAIKQYSNLPVFYTTNESAGKTYYYGKSGLIMEVNSNTVNTADGSFKNGRVFAEVDGEIKLLDTYLEFSYDLLASQLTKSGDKYFYYYSGVLVVFNEEKSFAYTANLSDIINNSNNNYTSNVFALSDGYVLIQTTVRLSENEALRDFDYSTGTAYYNLYTYVYDLGAQTYTQIDFNASVTGARLSDTDATALTVREINADNRLSNAKLVIVDHNLNKVIDLDAYMTNVTDFKIVDKEHIALTDGFTVKLFYNDMLSSTYPATDSFDEDFYQVGRYFYDASGNSAYAIDSESTLENFDSTNYVVYYSKGDDYFAFDLKSKQSAILDSAPTALSSSKNVFVTTNADGLKKVYNKYNASLISDKEFVSVVLTRESNNYTYFTAAEEDGTRHVILTYVG